MKQFKAQKIRIYPNKEQKNFIDKTLGATRALYNMMLHERISHITHENIHELLQPHLTYKTELDYMREYEWLKEIDTIALIQSKKNLEIAFSLFLKKVKTTKNSKELSFPRYKKKMMHSSYKTTYSNNNITIDYATRFVKLPRLGFVAFRDKRLEGFGEIISATVSRTSSEKYFVSLLFSSTKIIIPKKKVVDPQRVIGIDMSLFHFYVDHEGKSPHFTRNTKRYEKRLALEQKKLRRKEYQSKNYEKNRKRVAIIYEKAADSRIYFTQNIIHHLVTNYDAVCIERLDLRSMMKDRRMGRSISDVKYGEFVEKLKQKGQEYGTHIIQVSTFFPSSKLCSTCGYTYEFLDIYQREWICPQCNERHHRDVNAGKNLRKEGLKYLGLL